MNKQIIHVISNKEWGGGEQYAYGLCRHLKADGYDVKIVCRPIQQLTDRLQTLGLPITYMPLRGLTDLLSAWRLSRMLREGNHIVHVHNFKDAMTAVLARSFSSNKQNIQIIVTRHLVKKGKDSFIYQWLYKHIHLIVFVSELARNEFFLGHPSIDRKKTCVIRNSIELLKDGILPNVKEEFGIKEGTTVMMYHGRIAEEKGLNVLIDALALIGRQDYVMLLFGTGSPAYIESLRHQIEHYNLADKVIFAGFHPYVQPYIAQCDFGILPSVVRESSSLSCMEYMSMGKCVITTNHGGQAEYIENGKNSILIAPNDSQQLAERISELQKNRDLREQLGAQAKHDYEDSMSYEHFFEKMKKAYGL